MDIDKKTKLWNFIYHYAYHRWCMLRDTWVIKKTDTCSRCKKDEYECYIVGGKHDL